MDLSLLNDAQREAVTCIDSPSLVIAGAGSGKTRVLTYKIAYLLEQDYKPWNILALTFTNKAAREMQTRIGKLVDQKLANALWMGTFHSVFSRILRIECGVLGFTSNFTIYDASDSKSLVKTILREMQLDDKTYKPSTVCNRISEAKNRLIFPNQYLKSPGLMEHDASQRMPAIGEIYLRYMQRCRLSDAMDFDDLLLYTYYLFETYPEVLQKYQDRFEYVLVDEYQDTNFAQHRIVWQLTQHRQRVCVVGDDAQSIYSFRGANIDNILNFQKNYTGTRLFKLERNYRSTQNIVRAANSLIEHNRGQIRKEAYSENNEGRRIQLFNVQSDYEESIVVSHKVQALHGRDHIPYNDIAILYRTNSQSRSLEESLRKLSIPYRIYGGLSFYQRKEIKDVIAYLRLVLNPRDEEALKRIINYPARGIGDTTLQKVLGCAVENATSPWQVLMSPDTMNLAVNKGTLSKLEKFTSLIQSFHALTESTDAYTLAKRICNEAGVSADINKGREPEDISRQENLQELMDGIASFVEQANEEGNSVLLRDYLQQVSLLSDLDSDNSDEGDKTDEKVTLMTIHSAKGLEFRVVFVVGLEEELFPNRMALDEGQRGLEEERRLMYVAMTRAEEQLYLSSAKSRFRFGKTELSNPSRFLKEIDEQYINTGYGEGDRASASSSRSNDFLFGSSRSDNPFASSRSGNSFGSSRSESPFASSRSDNPFGSSRSERPFGSTNSGNPFGQGASGRSSSQTGTGNSASSNASSGISTSNLPPSVWGKTLRSVTSVSRGQSNNPASSNGNGGNVASPASDNSCGNNGSLCVGNVINHSRFGRGTIVLVEGTGLDAKATVDFDNVGRKILLLRFAKFTIEG